MARVLAVGGLALLAGYGCASDDRGGPNLARDPRAASSQVGEVQANIRLMLGFDTNKDGSVGRDEVEAGLKRQFEQADSDHNGTLNLSEIQAENARRWQASGTASSPLIDWNLDGTVSLAEFSGTAYSVFAQLDRDRGGSLAGTELEAPRIRGARPRAAGGQAAPGQPAPAPGNTFRPL
jgi:hypothetical protein